jgi:hypothetical protein
MKYFLPFLAGITFSFSASADQLRNPPVSQTTCPSPVQVVAPPNFPGSNGPAGLPVELCIGQRSATQAEAMELMSSADYLGALARAESTEAAQGKVLQIADSVVFWSGMAESIAIDFSASNPNEPTTQTARVGRIVGRIMLDDEGNSVIANVSSTFGELPPGGASVGNQ